MLPDLAALARDLCWAPAQVDRCRSWLGAYCDLLGQRLRACCGRDAESGRLLDDFLASPAEAQEEFLLSPAVSFHLLRRVADRPADFAELRRELARVCPRPGDGPGPEEALPPPAGLAGELRRIPLDLASDFPFPPRAPSQGPLSAVPPDRAGPARQHLAASLAALAQGNPVAHACVHLLTRLLAVREEASRPDRYSSNSFSKYVGLTLITNPWCVDAAAVIDALVHEAIHAALYVYEDLRELLTPRKESTAPLRSPWTGNMLSNSQYVQACFVWCGLARLWAGWPEGAGGIAPERVRRKHQMAFRGFLARPVEVFLGERGDLVSPRVRDALLALEPDAAATVPAG